MIIEVIVLTVILFLCFYIFFHLVSSKEIKNHSQRKLFTTMILWIIVWVISILLTDLFYENLEVSLWTSRFSFTSSALITYWYYLFVKEYRQKDVFGIGKLFWGTVTIFFIAISFTDLIVQKVFIEAGALKSQGGSMYELFAIYTGILFVYSAIRFADAYKKEKNLVTKTQMQYILVGSAISIFITFVTNLILPILEFKEIRALGPIGLLFFIFATYYAILRYRFLSSKLLISRFLYTLMLATIPYVVFYIVILIQKAVWGGVYETGAFISGYIYSVLFIYLYIYTSKKLELLVKRFLFNSIIDVKKKKIWLSHKLDSLLDFTSILQELKVFFEEIYNTKVEILVIREGVIQEKYSTLVKNKVSTKQLEILFGIEEPTLKDELSHLQGDKESIIKVLSHFKTQLLIPFKIKRNLNWNVYILLGKKREPINYSIEELEYIQSIISIVITSLQRAYLHKEVQDFNDTLKEKVDEQTKSLNIKISELKDARRREQDMMDIMGHELRTPLSIMRMSLGILESKYKKNPESVTEEVFNKYEDRISEALDREIRLLERMLSSTKIDADRMQMHLEKVLLKDILDESIFVAKEIADKKGVELDCDCPGENLYIYSDKIRLAEVIDNLLGNAIKYTEKGAVTVKIVIDKATDMVKMKITDTGLGIPKEAVRHLGEKFYRVRQYTNGDKGEVPVVRPGGTGLGLYVSFELVKLMGGKIKVDSELGKGSTFSISLPIYKNQKEVQTAGSSERDLFKRMGFTDKET